MSPSPGDVSPPSPEGLRPRGFAGVLKGLAGSKPPRTPTLATTISIPSIQPLQLTADPPSASSAIMSTKLDAFSPNHLETFQLLKHGSPNDRISAASTLRWAISEYPLRPVLDVWEAAKDLIEPQKSSASRTTGWELLSRCGNHPSATELERREYFQTLSGIAHPDDFHLQLAALVDLTNRGRDLSGFDYDVIPLLTAWLRDTYSIVKAARKKAKTSNAKAKMTLTGDERNLAQLFNFITDVVKFSSNFADDGAVGALISGLLCVCMNTSVEDDLRACISVIDAIITFGNIPQDKLKDCIHVLSSILSLVTALEKDAWHSISILLWSHNGQATIRVLLNDLRAVPSDGADGKDVGRDIRGAIAVIKKLLSKSREKRYPTIPLALLMDGLASAAKSSSPSTKIRAAILELINCLFDAGEGKGKMHYIMEDEDWSPILEVAAECAKDLAGHRGDMNVVVATTAAKSLPTKEHQEREKMIRRELYRLTLRLQALMTDKSAGYVPQAAVIRFLLGVHAHVPDSAAMIVLDYFREFRCCSPPDEEWKHNLELVREGFFNNQARSSQTRLKALQIIVDAVVLIELTMGEEEKDFFADMVKGLLADVAEETDIAVLETIVSLAVSVATTADMALFDYIMGALKLVLVHNQLRSPLTPNLAAFDTSNPPPPEQQQQQQNSKTGPFDPSPSRIVAAGYVKIFKQCMASDVAKAAETFYQLVSIARSKDAEIDARLVAMKLLFRLRADWNSRVHLATHMEVEYLADSLFRTEASIARKQAEEAFQPPRLARTEYGPGSRVARGVSFTNGQQQQHHHLDRTNSMRMSGVAGSAAGRLPLPQKYRPLWMLGEYDILFEDMPANGSPLLVISNPPRRSSRPPAADEGKGTVAVVPAAGRRRFAELDMAAWLEALVSVLTQGCDWEVYSFVLVHLPPQLSNHAIFRGAIPQIQGLRRIVCDMIRQDSFQEPPKASGLRRADVAICFYHSLTMLLSYHEHFQKAEEDDIVLTFVHGIGAWERCARCCIHALSICCHELPLSTSKSLVHMLSKMSTIITQPRVAIHILEFLASLSRLQNLFVNFQVEDYRVVYGICFRYLQYVRDKQQQQQQQANRNNSNNNNSNASEMAATPSTPATPVVMQAASPLELALRSGGASDELPQYVYALAYHVILFWFLAMRLPDRAKQVGWIARNLFADIDGGGPGAEEPALTTMDYMQRMAYADADESMDDPLFTEERFGKMAVGRWLIGNSIVTIKQAVGTGWAQITKRQPSGTSSYLVREIATPPPPHQQKSTGGSGSPRAGRSQSQSQSQFQSQFQSHPQSHSQYRSHSQSQSQSQSQSHSYSQLQLQSQAPSHSQLQSPTQTQAQARLQLQSQSQSQTQTQFQSRPANVVLPSHLLVQLMSSIPQSHEPALRPMPLPDHDGVDRAIRVFDRISSVDGHKVGVIYIGENQTDEVEILANVSGSSDYARFLDGLGVLTRLKGATFNTQGLDREYDTDGQHTFSWRDRVTEMVFHVTTQMPTDLKRDPQCINKKRHVGNDFVNIVFNDSGLPFRFDTFPSEYNYVKIVITPEARTSFIARRETASGSGGSGSGSSGSGNGNSDGQQRPQRQQRQQHQQHQQHQQKQQQSKQPQDGPFYRVQVMSQAGFPEISPAAQTKMVSLRALPCFIRLLALNASVFCQVWESRQGREYVGSWRHRLREIKRLREKYGSNNGSGANASTLTTTTTGSGSSPPTASSVGGGGAATAMTYGIVGAAGPSPASAAAAAAAAATEAARPISGATFGNLRRTSVATFLTTTSEQTSHRSSVMSTAAINDTEVAPLAGLDSVVESVDFSKWAA